MSGRADPYLLPNGTLRNKLGLTSEDDLQKAENRLTAGRAALLTANLPKPPFTFDTLRSIHRALFQDVYDWAGELRTGTLSKKEFDDPASPAHSFAPPKTIIPRAKALFRKLADQNYLTGLSRGAFAAGMTEAFIELNDIHFAREGNGRTQRILLTAMAENAGHVLDFDFITKERMIAVSIASHHGDPSGVRRMFDEIMDPRQVEAMRKAISFLDRTGKVAWNDIYIATTRAGESYTGALVGKSGSDFMLRGSGKDEARILIGDARDVPNGAASGTPIAFQATQFVPATDAAKPRPSALGTIVEAMRAPDAAAPWEAAPVPIAERVRAFEERAAKAKEQAAKPQEAPDAEPDAPKPRSGLRP